MVHCGLCAFPARIHVVPGLILFFFAIGAWIVAIISLFVDLSDK
jgi:hypothetical protein